MGPKLNKPNSNSNQTFVLYPFGDNEYGIISNSKRMQFKQFFCGHFQCFGVDIKDRLYSWGLNNYGQTGKPTVDDYTNKKLKKEGFIDNFTLINPKSSPLFHSKIRKISCGNNFSAILTQDSQVYTFGLGNEGQLGYELKFSDSHIVENTHKCQLKPRRIELFAEKHIHISDIECGKNFLLCLSNNGTLYGTGDNSLGQLASSLPLKYFETPILIDSVDFSIIKVKCGWSSVIALSSEGEVYQWGNPFFERNEDYPSIFSPQKIEGIGKTADIACGFHHFITMSEESSEDSNYVCTWGENEYYQLGYETKTAYTDKPKKVEISQFQSKIKGVFAGSYHSFCLLENNKLLGFGHNYYHEISKISEEKVKIPIEIELEIKDSFKNLSIQCGNGFTVILASKNPFDKTQLEDNDKNKIKTTELNLMEAQEIQISK